MIDNEMSLSLTEQPSYENTPKNRHLNHAQTTVKKQVSRMTYIKHTVPSLAAGSDQAFMSQKSTFEHNKSI